MDVVGAVLAGGAGSRLGGSKAAALLAGRPLLSYPLAALRAAVGEVAVVAKADTELPAVGYGVLIWREPDEPRHPLAGIVEALRRAEGRPVVVLACDLPFVTAELVRELVARRRGRRPGGRRRHRTTAACSRSARATSPRRSSCSPGSTRPGARSRRSQALRPAARSTSTRTCCATSTARTTSPPPRRSSAADRGHRARRLDEARLVDVVLELLAPDRVADDLLELVVARAGAQRRAQVGLVEREEAGAQPALGGQRMRLQSPQNGSLTGLMKPIRPWPSAKR